MEVFFCFSGIVDVFSVIDVGGDGFNFGFYIVILVVYRCEVFGSLFSNINYFLC